MRAIDRGWHSPLGSSSGCWRLSRRGTFSRVLRLKKSCDSHEERRFFFLGSDSGNKGVWGYFKMFWCFFQWFFSDGYWKPLWNICLSWVFSRVFSCVECLCAPTMTPWTCPRRHILYSIETESFVISYQYDSAKYDICCFTSWEV